MRIYNPVAGKYRDVGVRNPLPVTVVDDGDPTQDETVTVIVTRDSNGDTTQVIEHSSATDRTVTTNFTYVDA